MEQFVEILLLINVDYRPRQGNEKIVLSKSCNTSLMRQLSDQRMNVVFNFVSTMFLATVIAAARQILNTVICQHEHCDPRTLNLIILIFQRQ